MKINALIKVLCEKPGFIKDRARAAGHEFVEFYVYQHERHDIFS